MNLIRVVTAVIRDPDGRLLLVRKHGTRVFMMPGGKMEPRETPAEALARELAEEISLRVDPNELVPLGTRRAAAANEPDHVVEAELFAWSGPVDAQPAGEIAELWWRADDDNSDRPIAPLTRQHVINRL